MVVERGEAFGLKDPRTGEFKVYVFPRYILQAFEQQDKTEEELRLGDRVFSKLIVTDYPTTLVLPVLLLMRQGHMQFDADGQLPFMYMAVNEDDKYYGIL